MERGVANRCMTLRNNRDEAFIPAGWATGGEKQLQRVARSQNELNTALFASPEGHSVAALE